jgi:small subunit ribosomal protein S20
MAHHKSAKKRIRVTARRTAINKNSVSKLKTLTKKVLASKSKTEGEKEYKDAVSFIDKQAAKGRIHKNTAARRKSRITIHLNKLETAKK